MCQLLGVCSNKQVNIDFSLKEFQERGDNNPHGFGFAFYINGEWVIHKRPTSLSQEDIQQKDFRHKSKIIIGHVRLASCGNQVHKNTHPFQNGNWVFAHNGTVIDIKNKELNKYKPEGETDSEYAFCYLLDKFENKSNIVDIANILSLESREISKLGKFNFLLSDGETLFAFGDNALFFTERKSPFQVVTLKDKGYSCHLNEIKDPDEKAIIVATEPLTKEERWHPIKGLKIFKGGEEI